MHVITEKFIADCKQRDLFASCELNECAQSKTVAKLEKASQIFTVKIVNMECFKLFHELLQGIEKSLKYFVFWLEAINFLVLPWFSAL